MVVVKDGDEIGRSDDVSRVDGSGGVVMTIAVVEGSDGGCGSGLNTFKVYTT